MMTIPWSLEYAWAFHAAAWGLWLIAGIGLYIALLRDRSRGRRRCPKCWYDMAGVPGLKCPECGREARTERRLFSTRRRWRLVVTAVTLFSFGVVFFAGPDVVLSRFIGYLPITVVNALLRPFGSFAASTHSAWRSGTLSSGTRPPQLTRLLVSHYNNRLLLDPELAGMPILGHSVSTLGPESRLMLPGLECAAYTSSGDAALESIELLQRARVPGAADSLSRIAFDMPERPVLSVFVKIELEQLSEHARVMFFTRCEREATDSIILRVAACELSKIDLVNGRKQKVLDRLADGRPDVRRGVLYALAEARDEEWMAPLILRLAASDTADEVRATAVSVLPNIETDQEAFAVCKQAAIDDPSVQVRVAALRRACGEHPLLELQTPTPEIFAQLEQLYSTLRRAGHSSVTREAESLRRSLVRRSDNVRAASADGKIQSR